MCLLGLLVVGKITEAAVLYDRYHPSAVQLDAFTGGGMVPSVFKEQLWRAFNIKLSPKELGKEEEEKVEEEEEEEAF